MASIRKRTKRRAESAYENHLLRRFIFGFEKSCGEALSRSFDKACAGLAKAFKSLGEAIGEHIKENLQGRVTLQRSGILHIQPDRNGDEETQDRDR